MADSWRPSEELRETRASRPPGRWDRWLARKRWPGLIGAVYGAVVWLILNVGSRLLMGWEVPGWTVVLWPVVGGGLGFAVTMKSVNAVRAYDADRAAAHDPDLAFAGRRDGWPR